MSERSPVVVGVDGSEVSALALRVAAQEARETDAPLRVVHAWLVTDPGLPLEHAPRLDSATEEQLAERLHEHVVDAVGDAAAQERVTYGYPGRVLAEESEDAALVVVGSRGLGAVRSALLGSMSAYVLDHARCPVMVVHAAPTDGVRRVVVAIDGSTPSLEALRWADARARRAGVPLVAVHAGAPVYSPLYPAPSMLLENWQGPEVSAERLVGWLRDTLGAERAAQVEQVVDSTPAARLVLDQLHDDDLVVLGHRGQGGVLGLRLGSVARRVAAHAPGIAVVVGGHLRDD